MTNEAMSNLAVQLKLSNIHLKLRNIREEIEHLRKQLEAERTDPEEGAFFAYLKFAEDSLRHAAETKNPVLVRRHEPCNPGPQLVPERKRWSLFRNSRGDQGE